MHSSLVHQSMNSKKNTYTIVFDGHSDNPYVEKKSMTNGIAITTGHTDSADSFIIHFATKTKHKDALIAITADRDIIQKMKKLHVKTWHPDVFSSYHASQSKSHEKPQTMSSIELDWWLDQFQ